MIKRLVLALGILLMGTPLYAQDPNDPRVFCPEFFGVTAGLVAGDRDIGIPFEVTVNKMIMAGLAPGIAFRIALIVFEDHPTKSPSEIEAFVTEVCLEETIGEQM